MGTNDSGNPLSVSEAVVHEVAGSKGVPPDELNPPLYNVIDPDALEAIFRGGTGHISFEYHGYVVTVNHAGDVSLEPTVTD